MVHSLLQAVEDPLALSHSNFGSAILVGRRGGDGLMAPAGWGAAGVDEIGGGGGFRVALDLSRMLDACEVRVGSNWAVGWSWAGPQPWWV